MKPEMGESQGVKSPSLTVLGRLTGKSAPRERGQRKEGEFRGSTALGKERIGSVEGTSILIEQVNLLLKTVADEGRAFRK